MEFSWMIYIVSLITVLNPIGNAALYIGMVANRTPHQQRQIAIRCGIGVAVILVIVSWVGNWVLDFFGISLSAFQLAGGLIVVLIALSMLKGHSHKENVSSENQLDNKAQRHSIAIVPLATPIVAGPGSISLLISHSSYLNTVTDKLLESLMSIMMGVMVSIIFGIAPSIKRILGEYGMEIVSRVMGLILCAIAFQMIIAGMTSAFPRLVS